MAAVEWWRMTCYKKTTTATWHSGSTPQISTQKPEICNLLLLCGPEPASSITVPGASECFCRWLFCFQILSKLGERDRHFISLLNETRMERKQGWVCCERELWIKDEEIQGAIFCFCFSIFSSFASNLCSVKFFNRQVPNSARKISPTSEIRNLWFSSVSRIRIPISTWRTHSYSASSKVHSSSSFSPWRMVPLLSIVGD